LPYDVLLSMTVVCICPAQGVHINQVTEFYISQVQFVAQSAVHTDYLRTCDSWCIVGVYLL